MRRLSFPQSGPSPGAAQALECLVLDGRTEADRGWLKTESGLEETVKELMCAAPTRNGSARPGSSIVLSLVRTEDNTNDGGLIGVNALIETNRLVTVCFGPGPLIEDALVRYAERDGRGGASRLLAVIVTALVRPLESEIARIADTIDDLEDKAMLEADEGPDNSVMLVARRVITLRRYLIPMRDELSFLAFNPDELPGVTEPRYLNRAAGYPGRLISTLDSCHQRVTLILDQLRQRDDGRMNRSMHKLTLVGTVFLPLSFVTGLLGINVAGIPGGHDPFAFWLVCGFLLAVAVSAIVVIRWRKWL